MGLCVVVLCFLSLGRSTHALKESCMMRNHLPVINELRKSLTLLTLAFTRPHVCTPDHVNSQLSQIHQFNPVTADMTNELRWKAMKC